MTRKTIFLAALVAAAVAGCSSNDGTFAPPSDPGSLYWTLQASQRAVQVTTDAVAHTDTTQLSVVAYSADGAVFAPPDGVVTSWVSLDSTKVLVSSTGVVRGIGATQSAVKVVVAQQIGIVTRTDTVQVIVRANTKVLAALSAHQSDSAKVAAGSIRNFSVSALSTTPGDFIAGVSAFATLSDTTVARLAARWSAGGGNQTTLSVQGKQLGTTLLTVTTFVNGVGKSDTLTITVGYPVTNNFTGVSGRVNNGIYSATLDADTLDIGPGGIVTWTNGSSIDGNAFPGQTVAVIFTTPEGVAAALANPGDVTSANGNIPAIIADTGTLSLPNRRRTRKFITPGTYPYTITPFNLTGVIVVHDK